MRKILRTILTVCVAGILLYTLAGFFVAPPLVKRWIETVVSSDSGLRLEVERVTFNPYTFDVSFTNLTLYDSENKAAFSIGQSEAVLDFSSVLERHPVFSGAVELTGFETVAASDDDFYLAVHRLSAEGVSLPAGAAIVERVRVNRPEIRLRRDGARALNVPPALKALILNPAASRLAFDSIEFEDGRMQFSDDAVSPPSTFAGNGVQGRIEIRRVDGHVATAAVVRGQLPAPGDGNVDIEWQRVHETGNAELSIRIRDTALPDLSPYAPAIIDRPLVGGRIDLDYRLERADGRTAADLRLATKGLEFAEAGSDPAAGPRSVDLAVALLEQPDGTLRIARSTEQASAEYGLDAGRMLSRMLTAAITHAARNPFDVLSSLTGEPASALRYIAFPPGSAELIDSSKQNLGAHASALSRRPRLALVLRPAYDSVEDRNALARQQVRLHVILAASARPPGQADEAPLDFDDEKVRGVLDEFASTRLPEQSRAAIADTFPGQGGDYYRAVFDALVANQNVDEAALRRLARYRVQSAVSELIRLGIDDGRLIRDDGIDVSQGGSGRVRIELDVLPARRAGRP